jgi:hypothetical protein
MCDCNSSNFPPTQAEMDEYEQIWDQKHQDWFEAQEKKLEEEMRASEGPDLGRCNDCGSVGYAGEVCETCWPDSTFW